MASLRRLSMELTTFPNMELLKMEPLNRRQCKNLLDNFQNGVQAIQKVHSDFQEDVFDGAEKDMLRIMKKSRGVVEECCKENWCQVVMMQINNKELFRELLWDFECSFHLMCDIFRHSLPSQEDEINAIERSATFYPTSLDEVEEDQNSICEKLSKQLNLCKVAKCKDCTLAQYLLGQVRGLQKAEGGEFDSIIFPYEYPCPIYESPPSPLGVGGFGSVYSTQWLGFDTVTKVIPVHSLDHEKIVWREASILGGLNHPNIIKFLCCGLRTKRDKFGIEQKTFELVMEQGEMNLSCFLEQREILLTEGNAIELMLQIARGVCYLHDMKVAHRDLKLSNVVVTSKVISKARNLEDVHVKLIDFCVSKIEVKHSPEMPTNGFVYGTIGYMAPEAFEGRQLEIDAFKTDVFSFGMMCSEILTTKKHFDSYRYRDYVHSVLKGERPKLPETCSSELKSLIHKCWSLDPVERPTFVNICQHLTKLKGEAIVKAFYDVGAPKLVKELTSHIDSKTSQEQWWTTLKFWKFLGGIWFLSMLWQRFANFNQRLSRFLPKIWELNSIPSLPSDREVSNSTVLNPMLCEVNQNENGHLKFIGLDEQILEMEKILQHSSSLAFIGMGGIGKSTLAKILSAHISHQFDGMCFLGDFTDEKCTILLQYKLHPMNVHAETKQLREGRKILEQLQKTQKVLIVLDNVGNSSQLDELLGAHIFEDVNGSRLIASSRNWKSLERHVPIFRKINMQTLDEDQSRELFSMHAFTTNQPCLPYLKHVFEKIVSTCNGLPLSLEVMGRNLHGEKRLRVWERTMHRLLRARHDGTMDEKIWKTLRVSFDELNDKEKNMFLDIACFFCKDLWRDGIGFTKESLYRKYDDDINILQQTLESLQDKSLLKVDESGRLNMHDHLRDMGRMIVEMEYHETRIWNLCSATFTEHHNQKGMKFVEGLSFTTIEHNSKNAPDIHFNVMNNLQLLNVQNCENVDVLFAIMSQTTQLKWLSISFPSHCDEFSLQQEYFMNFFLDFAHDNLHQMRVLEICNSKICRSLDSLQVIPLKQLTFSNCDTFEEFPNGLTKLEVLEELNIIRCKNLKTIPKGLGNLTCLVKLQLFGCEALEEFPSGVCMLVALEELDLHGCKSLMRILEGFEGLTCLKKLYMGDCEALEEFPSRVCTLKALEELDFHGCKSIKLIPEGFGGLTCLKILSMGDCEALQEFPSGLCTLKALEKLDFHGCISLTKIPEGFASLTCLKKLYMWNCEALEEFPLGVSTLYALEELDFHGCKSLTKISEGFAGLRCLKKLYMWNCEALEEFPSGVRTLKDLVELDFHGCLSLTKIPEGFASLKRLKKLYMWNCEALEEFPTSVCTLNALEELNFHGCESLTNTPEDFKGLTNLKELKDSLAEEIGDLTFCIEGTNQRDDLMRTNSTINDSSAFEEQYMDVSLNDLGSSANLSPSHQQVNIQELEIVGRKAFVFHYTLKFLILIGGRLLGHSMATILFALVIKEVLKSTFRATLFSTITSSMMEIIFFCLLNLIPYWIHRRHHKELCIDKCGGYLFCERVGLCMAMIYVQVCSLWVWSLVCLCHQLPNPHIWSIVSLSFLWFILLLLGLSKIEWKYRLWSMLQFVLQRKAYVLADYIREIVPDLAPCNPFANVVNSQDVDKFITLQGQGLENLWLSMHCEEQVWKEDIHKHIEKHGHLNRWVLYPIKTNQRRIFLIGSGWVEVDVLEDDNFRFKSSARGHTVQYFYTTLSSQQFSTLLALLAMWEDSPNLGVLENFVGRSDGIYCHCMDLQSMVEALFECTNFIVVVLPKPIKFHIGAKCTSLEHNPAYFIASLAQVLTVVGTYFQLKDNYNNVAIVLTCLGILVVVGAITSPSILLLEKILVYNVLWFFRLGSQRLLRLYLQLKVWNCFLAFCDDFKPVLHRANVEPELITLFNCTHGSLTGDFDRPDWSEVEADQTPHVANAIAETNVLTSKSGDILEYRHNSDRFFDLKCRRTVHAESKYDGDVLETQLNLDGEYSEEYIWSEDSYFLFVYLVIKWSRREFGVIRSSRHLINRRYYHVFNVYELARHIAKHKLTKYKKLLDDSVDVMTRRALLKENVKLDPANKGEMVAGYHV